MNRLIIAAALLLCLLVAAEHVIEQQREAHRVLKATLRRLPGNANRTADAVRDLRITLHDTTWVYRFTDAWHYPAYENAYAEGDELHRFIEDLVESYGTIVATSRTRAHDYGLDGPDQLTVELEDSSGAWTQTVHIGRSLPQAAQEAYMAVAGNDTIFHMHADPRPILSSQRLPDRAPLIDPKVQPSALVRRGVVSVAFQAPGYPVRSMERVEIAPQGSIRRLQEGPMYEWWARIGTTRRKVRSGSVYAYLAFLARLTYADICSPQQTSDYGWGNHHIALTDESGVSDTLDVGATTPNGGTYVRNRTTGQVFALVRPKVALLFPAVALLDSLPEPSPFTVAEPPNPFGISAP